MNNTTKGEWKFGYASNYIDVYAQNGKDYPVIAKLPLPDTHLGNSVNQGVADTQEANAQFIALAGNLNQKYDLSKLEELIWAVKQVLDSSGPIQVGLQTALRSITR